MNALHELQESFASLSTRGRAALRARGSEQASNDLEERISAAKAALQRAAELGEGASEERAGPWSAYLQSARQRTAALGDLVERLEVQADVARDASAPASESPSARESGSPLPNRGRGR